MVCLMFFESTLNVGNMMSSMNIMVDGKQVNSVDDLPPEALSQI